PTPAMSPYSLHDALPIYVLAGELGQVATEDRERVVVERARREREGLELPARRPDEAGMAVTEVESRVRRQHVEVPVALDVGDPRSEEHTSELQSLRHLVC